MRSEADQMEWWRETAARHAPGARDRLGTLRHIGADARLRGVAALQTGGSVSLARRLVEDDGFGVTVSYGDPVGRPISAAAFDTVTIACHGLTRTHLDGLNHFSYDGTLYSGWAVDDPDGPTPFDWAGTGIFTRALHADICAVRGQEWCDPAEPLTVDDLEAAVDALGTECLPGDALLIDMGRDRFEAAGFSVRSQLSAPDGYQQTGMGPDAAAWIAEHEVAVVCWDFLDAVQPGLCHFSGHGLIWAVGQVFVDNCSYTRLHAARRSGEASGIGALVVAPLPAPRTTGSACNPLMLY